MDFESSKAKIIVRVKMILLKEHRKCDECKQVILKLIFMLIVSGELTISDFETLRTQTKAL